MVIPAPPVAPDRGSSNFSAQSEAFLDWLVVARAEFSALAALSTVGVFEENTFTPTISGSTLAGVGTYTTQSGRYSRIGNRVFFDVFLAWTAHTGTGNLQVSGMPFTSISTIRSTMPLVTNLITYTAANTIRARILGGATVLNILQEPSGGGTLAAVSIDVAGDISVSGCYIAA